MKNNLNIVKFIIYLSNIYILFITYLVERKNFVFHLLDEFKIMVKLFYLPQSYIFFVISPVFVAQDSFQNRKGSLFT